MGSRNDLLYYLTHDLNLSNAELEDLIVSVHEGSSASLPKQTIDWRLAKLQLKVIIHYKRLVHADRNYRFDGQIRHMIKLLLRTGSIRECYLVDKYPVGPEVTLKAIRVFDRRLERETSTDRNLSDFCDLCLPIVEQVSSPQSLFVMARKQLFRQPWTYKDLERSVWESLEEPLLRRVHEDGPKITFYTEERVTNFFKRYVQTRRTQGLDIFLTRILVDWPRNSALINLRNEILNSYEHKAERDEPFWKYKLSLASALRYAFCLEESRNLLASDRTIVQYLNLLSTFATRNIEQDLYAHLMAAQRCLVAICRQLDPTQKTFRLEIIESTKAILKRLARHSAWLDQLGVRMNPFGDAFRELVTLATLRLRMDPGNLEPDPRAHSSWS